jgi:hypothetical protein
VAVGAVLLGVSVPLTLTKFNNGEVGWFELTWLLIVDPGHELREEVA